MEPFYKKMPSVKKKFPEPEVTEQYEQPIGPPRPTAMQRFESEHHIIGGVAHRVKDVAVTGAAWMQRRGQEINREQRAPRQPHMGGFPSDPFGMSQTGNPFGGSMFPSSQHPFNDRAGPIQNDRQPPRKAPGARGTRTIYRPDGSVEVIATGSRHKPRKRGEDRGGGITDPFHVPKSMRHMF